MAQQAIDGDVHVVGISTLAAAHRTLLPSLMESLKKLSPDREIAVVCGGVVPEEDCVELKKIGVLEVFGPGTVVSEAARKVIELII